ncbi:hypothetical protein [Xanthomonas citri]|uniref:Uncharacterized protein n=2 Tax=Xanthomonas TaxID=338 RepID=A0A7Z7NIV4_XANCH|nr:hypothetical protein [Xanthomonas citri]SOO26315.1 hypothetical protein XFF6991_530164 [Xanthomonas phaseoli pv. phaseoli]ATS84141.1 hypothetical protein XcfCFBP6991P_09340 [Xanthomonas citri pv. phaseoli var. fuscans]QWN19261.1 hypothetical protein DGM98_03120 [Xanthomonas citri]UZB08681.1 hypothetical protein OM953_02990 [Xanthomonas citri pv. fuscans]SON95882.1 hypothetical protein XFF6990_290033 [Xanthomonas citri pv. fuscans]
MLAISSNFEWSTAINTHVWLRALRCGQTSTFDLSEVPQHIVRHGNDRVPFQSKNDTTVTGRHLGQQQALATTSPHSALARTRRFITSNLQSMAAYPLPDSTPTATYKGARNS